MKIKTKEYESRKSSQIWNGVKIAGGGEAIVNPRENELCQKIISLRKIASLSFVIIIIIKTTVLSARIISIIIVIILIEDMDWGVNGFWASAGY